MRHWARWPRIFGLGLYYWYKIALFDETPVDKFEAETISLEYIFQIFKINPLCVVLNHN
jgi:hypothetical protein